MFDSPVPWQAGLVSRASWTKFQLFMGSGVLISKRHVLTAAHCVVEATESSIISLFMKLFLHVVLSEVDLLNEDDAEIHIRVKKLLIHPGNSF